MWTAISFNDIRSRLVQTQLLEGDGHNNDLFPDEKRPEKPSCGSKVIGEFIKQHA